MDNPNIGVSVVVPTLNRSEFLADTLTDLLAQNHRPMEILVVDQSSSPSDSLAEMARQHPGVITCRRVPFRGLPRARNYGWQQARYEAIVFVDDDVRCGPSLISEHLRTLCRTNAGMVAGGVDEAGDEKTRGQCPGKFNAWTASPVRSFSAAGEGLVQHVAGCNFSAWRSVLKQAGGFDEALTVGAALYEETETCLRVRKLGYDIAFNGTARVRHLTAGGGGCRVPELPRYVGSLAHNRAILIARHLQWFQRPVAYLRLGLLLLSYALHYQTMAVFQPAFAGALAGARAARLAPVCSRFGSGASK
jgi:GT2 family glycosyltransferase